MRANLQTILVPPTGGRVEGYTARLFYRLAPGPIITEKFASVEKFFGLLPQPIEDAGLSSKDGADS